MLKNEKVKNALHDFLKYHGSLVVFLFIWLVAAIFVESFVTLDNMLNIVKQAAIPTITCLGVTCVLMIGCIDLSVGYTVGLCSYMSGYFVVLHNIPMPVAILLTLCIGAICGLFNGVLVKLVKMPPFIVTLSSGYIIYGLAQMISDGTFICPLPQEFLAVARSQFAGLPAFVWISAVIVCLFYFLMHKTTFGRTLSSIGYNIHASKLSGINDDFVVIICYTISGVCAAIVGILMSLRVNNCTPILGISEHTFTVITGAVLGGASLSGGKGKATGAVLGMLTIMIIENVITLAHINYYIYSAALSIIILGALVFESQKNKALQ